MKRLLKRGSALLLALAILISLCAVPADAASLPSSLYIQQATNVSCSRASNTMMLRARAYLSGNDNWSSINEQDLTNCGAWSDAYGMGWSYTLNKSGMTFNVNETAVSGLSLASLKSILNAHPEGIAMYCGRLPHCIFVTDYVGDTIYASDPGWGYSHERRALTSSYFGTCYGSQANILANVTAYWYVSSYNVPSSGNSPIGYIDSVSSAGEGKIRVRGWALDLDQPTTSLDVHIYIGGGAGQGEGHVVKANQTRTDIASAYSGAGSAHGFDVTITTGKSGNQSVYAYGINVGSGSNALLNNSGCTVSIPADTTKPTISNVKVSNITSAGYTVTCTVSDNVGVTKVLMPTWTNSNGQDDIVWHNATISGSTASFDVKIGDHNNEFGAYITHIYAWDAAGNSTSAAASTVTVPALAGNARLSGAVKDGWYIIGTAVNPNYVLDAANGGTGTGTNVQLWLSNNSNAQLWYIKNLGDGTYSICGKGSNRFINIAGGSKANGTNIHLWCTGTPNADEKWKINVNSDGTYTFIGNVNNLAMDLSSGTASNGGNIHCWSQHSGANQKWVLFPVDLVGPSITDIKVTEVTAAGYRVTCTVSDPSGVAKVQFPTWTTANGQDDLIWHNATISGNTATFYVKVSDHKNESGTYTTHLYAWDSRGNAASVPAPNVSVPTIYGGTKVTGTLADGVYVIGNCANPNYVLDVTAGATAAGTNVQLYLANNSEAQLWYIKNLGDGTYSIRGLQSGRYINVAGSGKTNGTNIHIWNNTTPNGDEKWSIVANSDGTYTFVAATNGLALDLNGGTLANGQNIQCYTKNTSTAQKWVLAKMNVTPDFSGPSITDIKVTEVTAAGYRVTCTVSDPSGVAKVQFPTWTTANGQDDLIWHNATISGNTATFYVKVSDHKNESGTYTTHLYAWDSRGYATSVPAPNVSVPADTAKPTITNVKVSNITADGYTVTCTVADNVGVTKVLMPTWTSIYGQDDIIWHGATLSGSTATFNVKVSDHKYEAGAYITHIYADDAAGNTTGVAAPSVSVPVNLTPANGTFRIATALDTSKGLDISGVSTASCANLHLWTYGDGNNQKFTLTARGNGYYSITAAHSGLVLDVENGNAAAGANVRQCPYNGSDAQLWKFEDAGNGYVYIRNKLGMRLDVCGAATDNGTNIQTWYGDSTNTAQMWKLSWVPTPVTLKGYAAGYNGGMGGDGTIRAYGIDVSEHQGTGFNFQNLKNAGYSFVILRCGFVSRKDYRFEEYYAAAKAAGLNVGVYFYSYASTAAEASAEADICLSYIQGKQFEYPVYFDFEDASARSYNGALAKEICTAFLSKIEAAGYLPGLYGYASWMDPNYGAWVPTSSICSKWECWMANYYDNTPTNAKSANYPSTYGMYQYTSSNYVNGVGPLDTNVAYKDYPTIVKTYHFNGY